MIWQLWKRSTCGIGRAAESGCADGTIGMSGSRKKVLILLVLVLVIEFLIVIVLLLVLE